jgi:hypothetical protein
MTWNFCVFCMECNASLVLEKLRNEHAEFMLDHTANTGHSKWSFAVTTSVGKELFSDPIVDDKGVKVAA